MTRVSIHGIDERQPDVSRRGQSRQKIEVLEHEPDPTLCESGSAHRHPVARPHDRRTDSRPDGPIQTADTAHQSRRPEPDGPISATHSPRSIRASIRSSTGNLLPPSRYDFDRLFRSTTGWTLPGWVHSYRNASDRIERRGATRGIQSEENPDRRRHGHGDHDGLQRKHHLPSREPRIANPNRMPARIPITPPTPLMTTASIRNCPRISGASPRPPSVSWISRIRCVTLASMMFMIPMPPTRSEIAAITPARC